MNNTYKQWLHIKETSQSISAKDAAKQIGVSEAELMASRLGTDTILLQPNWQAILSSIQTFGQVMALTRNEYCVHERKGIYIDPMIAENNKVGLIISPDIDLRFMLEFWSTVFAVIDQVPESISTSGQLKSIQFFDKFGDAAHKIYLINASQQQAWDAFINEFKAPNQTPSLQIEEKPLPPTPIDDQCVDIQAFANDWRALTDTHQFEPLVRRYQLTRPQAFRLIGNEFAEKLPKESLPSILERAAAEKLKLMVFVGNRACVQIHTGLIENIKWSNGWFNVLDPFFDLHLKAEHVAQLWLVRKQTSDGIVTSIEAFDAQDELILQLYGPRRAGIAEYKAWRDFAENCKTN